MIERKTFIAFDPAKVESIEYLIGIVADARATTLRRTENITVTELDWQYAPGWNGIGALLAHIIATQNFFRIYFIEGRPLTAEEEQKWRYGLDLGEYVPHLINGKTIEAYREELDAAHQAFLLSLSKLNKEDFTKKRQGYDPVTGHNLAWTLYHMAEDEVHHRGQISLLRKLYHSK